MNVKNFLLILLALGLLCIGIHRMLLRQTDSLETIASTLVYPVILFQNSIVKPIENSYRNWHTNKELLGRLAKAQVTIESLQAELVKFEGTQEMIDATAELRNFASRYYPTGQLAHIIMKEFDSHHTFSIDVGSTKGIETDMIAIYKNCIIGRVSTVYPYWSKVVLLTDPTCKIAAFTTKTHRSGILEGTLRLDATHMSFISHLDAVQLGELVLSSGEGLVFPRGYALGTIEKAEPDGFNLAIEVKPMIDLTALTYCYIAKKGAVAPYEIA